MQRPDGSGGVHGVARRCGRAVARIRRTHFQRRGDRRPVPQRFGDAVQVLRLSANLPDRSVDAPIPIARGAAGHMTITENQRSAIEAPGNVLVMAGAGSGKTSTLVERCLHHVLHPKEPVSVAEMLIVTFTEAAAAEVRRRIVERLESARSKADGGVAARLEREIALIESAQISTLHSFCLQLVREHFQELGLDPSMLVFRDEQAALVKQTAIDRIMGRHFESATKDAERVLELIETYVSGDDSRIRRLIVKLHNYAQTLAHPARWFAEQIASLQEPEPRLW